MTTARILLWMTFVGLALFVGAVCVGCDTAPIAELNPCSSPMYVAPCDYNVASRCWAGGTGPRVTGCSVSLCQSSGEQSTACADSASVPCVEACTPGESWTDETTGELHTQAR